MNFGCAYSTETGEGAINWELFVKTNIKNISFDMLYVFTDEDETFHYISNSSKVIII